MSGRAPEFEVERFERVTAGGGTVLLRIAGRWRADSRERLAPPLLLLDDGRRTRSLAALPGPDDASPLAGPDPPPWRAAFSAPAALLSDGHLAFALQTARGIIDLPRPKEAAARTPKRAKPPSPSLSPPAAPAAARRLRRRASPRRCTRSAAGARSPSAPPSNAARRWPRWSSAWSPSAGCAAPPNRPRARRATS